MSFRDLEKGEYQDDCIISIKQEEEPCSSSSRPARAQVMAAAIFEMNTAVSSFKRLVNALGTRKDTPFLRDRLHTTRARIEYLKLHLAGQTSNQEKRYKHTAYSNPVVEAKLHKDYLAVLQDYQRAQQAACEIEYDIYIMNQTAAPAKPGRPSREIAVSAMAVEDDQAPILQQLQEAVAVEQQVEQQQQLVLEDEISYNEAIIAEREQGIREIQEQIQDVNEIFRDLGVLVREQGVMVEQIESNVDTSHAVTLQANTHLSQASKSHDEAATSGYNCLLALFVFVMSLLFVYFLFNYI